MPETPGGDTAAAILDSAERLVQRRGFNGFSYADVSAELGITKAALHYHFPGKAELGERLIERYAGRVAEALEAIDAEPAPAPERLRAYCDIYRRVLTDGRMCLCGMLAAEYHTLTEPMRSAVTRFFDRNESWVTSLLEAGRADGSLVVDGAAVDVAQLVIATLEGAMLVSRFHRGSEVFDAVVARLLADLTPGGRSR